MRGISTFGPCTLITAFCMFFCTPLLAQVQQGPLSPGHSANGNCSFSYGSALNLAPSVETLKSDDVYAVANHCACCDANTSCLRVDSFGFSIPAAATITGIIVEIEKRASAGSNIQDNGLRLLKNGVETGSNGAQSGTPWPYTDTYVTYGSCTDLWGTTWTPADINSGGFGLFFANIDYTCGGITTSYIDHIRVTVCYDACIASVNAGFSADDSLLTVSCTDQSAGATAWYWDFGDGSTSTLQNPVHTYTDTGTYTICLVAFDGCGSDTVCTELQVLCPLPDAGFTHSNTAFGVSFTNLSSGADSWHWNFGDGSSDVSESPTHVYTAAGTYQVCLRAENGCGADSLCTQVTVAGDAGLAGTDIQEITLYPNPASGFVTLSFGNNEAPAGLHIRVYDISGRQVAVPVAAKGTGGIQLDVSALSPGMYRMRLEGPGITAGRSFVIRRP